MDYDRRLCEWIASAATEDDRRTLFEFASEITFFNREDFGKLYEAAMSGPISRWLVDELKLSLSEGDLPTKVADAAHSGTWYCPLSDSMPIADFHHANGIGGIQYRPDWRSIVAFGEIDRLKQFMNSQHSRIDRIVLLEDFVGAGWQISEPLRHEPSPSGLAQISHDVVTFAQLMPNISFLFVPLIICPEGAEKIRDMVAQVPNAEVSPVLELSDAEFISPHHPPHPGTLHERVFDLASRLYPLVKGNGLDMRPYTAYGNSETGARVVMYSNTPAGSLPIIHHTSNTWNPPFPRSARVK
ncbi:MAG: hypothetical protein WD049_00635 [Candidatus Paceibacterota bacterium]